MKNFKSQFKWNMTFLIILVLFYSNIIIADYGEIGPKFLYFNPSAYINSIGKSFVALDKNADAIEENPGGCANIDSFQIGLSATKWLYNINYYNIKTTIPVNFFNKNFNLLFTTSYAQYPEVSYYNLSGENIDTVRLIEGYAGAGISTSFFNIKNKVRFGVLFKYIYRNIYNNDYSALVCNIGLQKALKKKRGKEKYNVGIVLKNIGLDFNKNKLPTELGVGIANKYFSDTLLVKIDTGVQSSFDFNSLYLSPGLEYNIKKIVMFQAGIKYQNKSIYFTTGLGINCYHWKNGEIRMNYAFLPMIKLSEYNNHQISVNIIIKKSKRTRTVKNVEETDKGLLIRISDKDDVLFEYNKAALKRGAYRILDKVLGILNEEKDKGIVIYGHTDNTGKRRYNLRLSKARAKSVYNYFLKNGIEKKRMTYDGYGENIPIADNNTKEGRAINRRVEIILLRFSQKDKEKFDYYFYNGLDYYYKEGYELAIKEWEKALEIDPENDDIKKRIELAEEELKKKE